MPIPVPPVKGETFRLNSTAGCYAPGMVRAFRALRADALVRERADEGAALYMLASLYPDLPGWGLLALVRGDYRVEGDAVIVTRNDAPGASVEE
jgi:hypothetical protein